MRYILLNFNISLQICLTKKNYGSIVFFYGQGLFLPMLTGKVWRKKIYWLLPSSMHEMYKFNPDPFSKLLFYYYQSSLDIVDHIILFSPRLISEWNLEKFRNKILVCPFHNVNVDMFTITTPYPDRPCIIGYIGRLSAEKGLQNFVKALPSILSDQPGMQVYIFGEGPLKESSMDWVQARGIQDHVKFPGWVSHDELPDYLNKLQLLVIPSYTEGGPTIMVEAMACGTPVLATQVGVVQDFIRDGETGFIMKNNSPECIAENVIRALSSPNLDKIAENARLFLDKNLTLENSIQAWKRILDGT